MAETATKRAVARKKGEEATNGKPANAAQVIVQGPTANGHGNGDASNCRTTAVFPIVLNQNWELYALKKRLQKNEVLIRALKFYLEAEGFEPDKIPKFEVTY